MSSFERFSQILRTASLIVSYSPMRDELDPKSLLKLASSTSQIVTVSQDASIDPQKTSREFYESHRETDVACILIPGRAFDLTGTRHGRGGGWYDRFLHTLPHNWLRIGVAKKEQVHQSHLLRSPWDEPMDWILVNDDGTWSAHRASSR